MIIELKAKVGDLAKFRNRLAKRGAKQVGTFHQIDTYYNVPNGRLKLREAESETDAHLIYYEREDVPEPKKSSVFILTIPQPQTFKQKIAQIMKIKAVVDKVREIYIYKTTQIHFDTVKNLGFFIEFERKTSQERRQQEEDVSKLENLREQLEISPQLLERLSYSDLI